MVWLSIVKNALTTQHKAQKDQAVAMASLATSASNLKKLNSSL